MKKILLFMLILNVISPKIICGDQHARRAEG